MIYYDERLGRAVAVMSEESSYTDSYSSEESDSEGSDGVEESGSQRESGSKESELDKQIKLLLIQCDKVFVLPQQESEKLGSASTDPTANPSKAPTSKASSSTPYPSDTPQCHPSLKESNNNKATSNLPESKPNFNARNNKRGNQSNARLYAISAVPDSSVASEPSTSGTSANPPATRSPTISSNTSNASSTIHPANSSNVIVSAATAGSDAASRSYQLRSMRAKPKSLQLYGSGNGGTGGGAGQVIPLVSSGSLNFIDVPVLPPESLLFKPQSLSPNLPRRRRKFSSTETMFIRNHLHTPDVRQIIRCLAKAITLKLKTSMSLPSTNSVGLAIFDETYYTTIPMLERYPPSVSTYQAIHDFLAEVFHQRRLTAECAVVAVAYIDRLLVSSQVHFDEFNWCLISFTALLLAHKVWSEHAVWNEDFVKSFPKAKWLSIDIIRKLEREFLKKINFNLNVKPSVYGRYYFELRSFLTIDEVDFPYFPMNKKIALLLDERSRLRSSEVKRRNRSQSFDSLEKKDPGHTVVSFDHLIALRKDIVFSTSN